MRDPAALRGRLLERLDVSIRRPWMFATSGREYESFAWYVLGDLCFLDEREDAFEQVRIAVAAHYGRAGVAGAFEAAFGGDATGTAEVTSVYARAAVHLGYLDADHRRDRTDWDALTDGLTERYAASDGRASDVVARHGTPALTIDRRVLCYAGPDEDDWIAFDCWEPWAERYDPDQGTIAHQRPEDPLLRDIRIPAETFAESLVLTRYGKLLHQRRP